MFRRKLPQRPESTWALTFRHGGEGGGGGLSNEVECEQRPEHLVRPQ